MNEADMLRAENVRLKELSCDAAELAWWKEDAKKLITELAEFVSACRYAGPDGLDRLKEEATRLYQRAREAIK